MSKPVILTGLRANSEFHIGNFLGAIRPIVKLQQKHAGNYQINMFVPDLHSITTPIDHGSLYQQTIDNLKIFIAAGLNINDSDTYIYRQSYIPAHSELAWILSCFTYFGELSRMTQFKDKSKSSEGNDSVSAGLYNYPILMAADILLYEASYIPLGDDQKQHLELARDLSIRINNKFGSVFKVPHEWNKQLEFSDLEEGVRIRSLRNPDKKMSKSVSDPAGTILLSDDPKDAAKKVMSATTDNLGIIGYDWEKQPGVSNLLRLEALINDKDQNEINTLWVGKQSYGDLKTSVAKSVEKFLTNLNENLNKVEESTVMSKLKNDEIKMNDKANSTLAKVQTAVGLRPN